jgi:hypothetical protein
MDRTILLIVMFALLVVSASAQQSEYIGYKYKPVLMDQSLPNGVKGLGGAIISDPKIQPMWGIARMSKGNTQMLWLEKSIEQDEHGVKKWEVLDVLTFVNFPKSRELLFGVDECRRNAKEDNRLVVQASLRRGKYIVEKAWIADTSSQRFVSVSVSGIRCEMAQP